MATYRTRQRGTLLEFLARNRDEALSIDAIELRLRAEAANSAPGRSTVYRLVSDLAEEGVLRRMAGGDGRMLYQYASAACEGHLHLKCTSCGRIIHLSDAASQSVQVQLYDLEGLLLDNRETVLAGTCAACGPK